MWHDPLLFCSVTSHTQRCGDTERRTVQSLFVCVWFLTSVSSVLFLCPSAVFVQTLVCYADFFVLCIVWWVLIKSSSLFSGELSALF